MQPATKRWSTGRNRTPATVVLVALIIAIPGATRASEENADIKIEVLSNRADLISGGQALVEVLLPSGALEEDASISLNGEDASAAFAVRPDGRLLGLVGDLVDGENMLVVSLPGVSSTAIVITNHAIGGPVLSGHQVEPWQCDTSVAGVGEAIDESCNAPEKQEFFLRSGGAWSLYDPASPPGQVDEITTDHGKTVPAIALRETGTINRGIYQFAILIQPGQVSAPWLPPNGWNRKLLYGFEGGASCLHRQGTPEYDVLYDRALSRGFAVASSTLNTLGQNCNTVVSAETVMMVKEMLTERFGQIRYTIGTGSSGGGLQQQVIAGAYPGLLDAISPGSSFMDTITTLMEIADCSLLNRHFTTGSPQLWANPDQRAAVQGHQTMTPCAFWTTTGNYDRRLISPTSGCGFDGAAWVYHPQNNRGGVRCTAHDYMKSIFGHRAQDGFANSPHDNVGVQYGLRALEEGRITTEQFVDINENIGGYDIDMNWQTQRTSADLRPLEIAYRSGQVNSGREMAKVPVVDRRSPPQNADIHTTFRSFAMRARLQNSNGHADNQIIWMQGTESRAFDLNDAWLSAIESDSTDDSIEMKVLRNKPTDAVDACWVQSQRITNWTACTTVFPHYGDPRIASGGPLRDDILKCALKPLDRNAYQLRIDGEPATPIVFTDGQWGRMQNAFSDGVCDWSQPGVGQQPTVPWLTFAGGPAGEPIGDPPTSGPLPSEACSDGQITPQSNMTGMGVRIGGTPPNATRVIICSAGPVPVRGAITVRVDPMAPNAYLDVSGDETNSDPCLRGFFRVRAETSGPRFYESPHGTYDDDYDPDQEGRQPPPNLPPDEWAANISARCGAPRS